MEIVDAANQWAKDEVFSSKIFILVGIMFLLASVGFWQTGITNVAKAYIYPTLVAGSLLFVAGMGFYFSNKSRLSSFEADYKKDPSAFIKAEITRTEKTMGEYQNIAFKVFPVIIAAVALLIVFVNKPTWHAIGVTTIALMICLIWVDSNANARIKAYHQQLVKESNRVN